MIIPALLAFVSCGGKRKSWHLEFEFVFWKPEIPDTVVGHIVTGDHFRFETSHNVLLHEDNLKEDKFLPRYDSAANGKTNFTQYSEGRLHVVRKGSP